MRLNRDCMHDVMLFAEGEDSFSKLNDVYVQRKLEEHGKNYTSLEIQYAMMMLKDAGYAQVIKGEELYEDGVKNKHMSIERLTYAGHQYLSSQNL